MLFAVQWPPCSSNIHNYLEGRFPKTIRHYYRPVKNMFFPLRAAFSTFFCSCVREPGPRDSDKRAFFPWKKDFLDFSLFWLMHPIFFKQILWHTWLGTSDLCRALFMVPGGVVELHPTFCFTWFTSWRVTGLISCTMHCLLDRSCARSPTFGFPLSPDSLTNMVLKKANSWVGGALKMKRTKFCSEKLMEALPCAINFLCTLIPFKWYLQVVLSLLSSMKISRNWFRIKRSVTFLKLVLRETEFWEFCHSNVAQQTNTDESGLRCSILFRNYTKLIHF